MHMLYVSRLEQRYRFTRRELLAVVDFIHHFRNDLMGQPFTLLVVPWHDAWIQNFGEPQDTIDFSVVHTPGVQA